LLRGTEQQQQQQYRSDDGIILQAVKLHIFLLKMCT
jgi:hypothetical protein